MGEVGWGGGGGDGNSVFARVRAYACMLECG